MDAPISERTKLDALELDDRHRVRQKLIVLLSSFVVGFVCLCGLAYQTLSTVRVGGPTYGFILQKNEVIADVLPPPEYVVESYLVVHQLVDEQDPSKKSAFLARLAQLRRKYDDRHVHWSTTLPDGPLRTALVIKSHAAAMKFHQTIETEFLPAIRRDDKAVARAIAVGSLKQSFEEHRGYVDEVVELALSQSHGAEQEASRLISQRSSILLALAGGILLTVLTLGVMLSRRIFWASQALEREIVDRKRAENDLRESEALRSETLRRSHDFQSALLHSISHDLHSPLASIDGSAILMAETDAIEERQEHARQIQAKSHSMLTLVDNLLDMLRLEAGVLKPRCEWQFLDEALDMAVQRCENLMNGRQIKVLPSADLPALFIDGVLILQVLTNLIDNAVKYSFPNSVIEIQTHIVGQTVEVSVSNDGEGIPSDQREDLFRPFYRGTNNPHDTPTKAGSGLGLAICKGIVEAHDGRIRIHSGPTGKTSICFSLPILEQGHSILDELHPVVESFHFTLSTEQA